MELELRVLKECEINATLDASMRSGLVVSFPHRAKEFGQCRSLGLNVPCYTAVLAEGQKTIAQVAVMDRTILVAGKAVRVAGVANVFVLPDSRGLGFTDKLLEAAMDEAKKRGFQCGFLFTHSPIDKIYARNGWIDITDRECIRVEDGLEISMEKERIRMYHPLGDEVFPQGRIHLQANKW